MADAESELDRLYGLPLEEFTAARNEAAEVLKASGDAEAALTVKEAKKPTRPAWMVNILAREKRKGVEALLRAGERLREVQERMVAGDADPAQLRTAAAAEQREIDSLLGSAREMEGASAQILDRVGETLQAAAGDPELADTIRAGRLDRERRASSLGLVGPASARPKAKAKGKGPGAAEQEAEEAEARERKEAAAQRARAERRVEKAERSLERARGLMEKAEQALAERRERVEEAEEELEAARMDL